MSLDFFRDLGRAVVVLMFRSYVPNVCELVRIVKRISFGFDQRSNHLLEPTRVGRRRLAITLRLLDAIGRGWLSSSR